MNSLRSSWCLCAVLCLATVTSQVSGVTGVKNIILLIADGGGFNQFTATSYYQYGALGHQVYDGPGWVKFGCTTYNSSGSYSPSSMWSVWSWQYNSGATDSAAAATAINTGVKSYDKAINVNTSYQPLTTIAQIQDARGRATGAVSTVHVSHATPACVWAHNTERDAFAAIANEMIYNSGLDVILGAGNPDFDNDGQPASTTTDFIGGATTWTQLKTGTTGKGWTLIESKADFQAYAANPAMPADRLIGIAQVSRTLQEERAAGTPLNTNVPDLATMSMTAVNVLSKNPSGFYVMIEGGAVDWANCEQPNTSYPNFNMERMLEEMVDFNHAVEAVVNWVETHSSWNQTLVIVTADHESGCLWGPGSGGSPLAFNPIVNNGTGVLPGGLFKKLSHTSQLVPLYARGPGSELFASKVDGTDSTAATKYGFSGQYVDNTDIFQVMNTVATAPFVCDPVMAADLNHDCRVSFADYALMATSAMDFLDLRTMTSDWLNCSRVAPDTCD
jgi:alkaline phosphatase